MRTTPAGIVPSVCFYVSLYACLDRRMGGGTGRVDSTRATNQGLSFTPARQHTHTHAHTGGGGSGYPATATTDIGAFPYPYLTANAHCPHLPTPAVVALARPSRPPQVCLHMCMPIN